MANAFMTTGTTRFMTNNNGIPVLLEGHCLLISPMDISILSDAWKDWCGCRPRGDNTWFRILHDKHGNALSLPEVWAAMPSFDLHDDDEDWDHVDPNTYVPRERGDEPNWAKYCVQAQCE